MHLGFFCCFWEWFVIPHLDIKFVGAHGKATGLVRKEEDLGEVTWHSC